MRRAPMGLAGALVLVAVAESAVARARIDLTPVHTLDWGVTARASGSEAAGKDVLVFGDSLAKFGLNPRAIAARTGLRAYNLALCGGQAPSSYFLLRRALESGARPSAVVVDFMPHLLAFPPQHNLRSWPELLDAREFLDLNYRATSGRLLWTLAAAEFLPSFRARDDLRALVSAIARGGPRPDREKAAAHLRNWRVNAGAQVAPRGGSALEGFDIKRYDDFYRDAWKCYSVNAVYVRRFFELAESNGVRAYWLLPPVSPAAQARRERLGVDAKVTSFVRATAGGFANVRVIDGRYSGYGDRVFVDPVHLDRRGAASLSAAVADRIAADLRSRGAFADPWVALPAYRAVRPGVALEDTDGSRLALGRGETEEALR